MKRRFLRRQHGYSVSKDDVTTGPGGITWKGQCFFFTLTREVQVFMVRYRPGAVA